jgi:hypothetical protein
MASSLQHAVYKEDRGIATLNSRVWNKTRMGRCRVCDKSAAMPGKKRALGIG